MLDLEDKLNERYANGLRLKLAKLAGTAFNNSSLAKINTIVREHTLSLRGRGVPFPQLRAIVLPVQGYVELVRADLEPRGIQTIMKNLVTMFPTLQPRDLAIAIRGAFPDYRPDEIPVNELSLLN